MPHRKSKTSQSQALFPVSSASKRCCPCNSNGIYARCKRCSCVTSGQGCTSCQPKNNGLCCNVDIPLTSNPLASDSSSLLSSPASSYTNSPTIQSSSIVRPSSPQFISTSSRPLDELFQPSSTSALLTPLSQLQPPSSPSLELESQSATCCKCHSSGARCTSCKCSREGRPCVNCYPGKRGKCTNIASPIPPASSPQSEASLQSHSLPSVATPETMIPCALRGNTSYLGAQESGAPIRISHPARKKCVVPDCPVLVAPSMWHSHMSLHASGLFPGAVPITWLQDQDLFICSLCHQLVSNTRSRSHSTRCRGRVNIPVAHQVAYPQVSPTRFSSQSLPSFEEVCELHRPTLRFISSRARPAFARVLSASLRSVLSDNSEEAWLKLFMLPKCVLPSAKRRGRNLKPTSIEVLCKL